MSKARRSRSEWQRLVDEVRGSTVATVAKRHGVRRGTLAWWKWRLSSDTKRRRVVRPRLVRVVTSEAMTVATPQYIELSVDGVGIRVEVGCEVEYVARLVRAIRSC